MTDRKKDHIALALESQSSRFESDGRFYYEPLLSAHPDKPAMDADFFGKKVHVPIWVSSMTGGTQKALAINRNLATACRKFGMGMGLGSCRSLLYEKTRLDDFNMREIIGDELPLFSNLGIAQLEQLLKAGELEKVHDLIALLRADGLVIHVNPLQEWLQPEGDRLMMPPVDVIEQVVEQLKIPVIVKEVGQGMGPQSLKRLLGLPLTAIELAAFGGTNFATIEMKRRTDASARLYEPLASIGHTAEEMVDMINVLITVEKPQCRGIIISGGINNFLDGYYLINKIKMPAIYGQASAMLRYATESYEQLEVFIETQVKGLQLAYAYLKIKNEKANSG
jgi:isopentenyl-diphosphate Delta-isomerase